MHNVRTVRQMSYCKTIAKRYSPRLGPPPPHNGSFTWKGYYLALDGRTYYDISFTESTQFVSEEERIRRFNKWLVKREQARQPMIPNQLFTYGNNAATTWARAYFTKTVI